MGASRTLLSLAVIAAWLLAPPAWSQSDADKSRARELALETGDLLDSGKYGAALERIEHAEQLYHAPTHLQMKGEALEGLGRYAEAMTVYERLEAEPIPTAATEAFRRAQAFATERLRELIAIVPSVLVKVRGADRIDVSVALDGQPYTLGAEAVRVDAGEHDVVVAADGFERVERRVSLQERGGVKVIDVVLRPTGSGGVEATGDERETDELDPDAADDESGSYVPAIIALSVGGAALVVAAITGGVSLAKVGDLDEACPDKRCSDAEQSDIDSTETIGNVSTAMFVVAGAGVAAGIVLLLLRPRGDAPEEARAVAPLIGPTFVGVRGTF